MHCILSFYIVGGIFKIFIRNFVQLTKTNLNAFYITNRIFKKLILLLT